MRISKDREERKNEIVTICRDLFLKNGYNNTSVDDIVSKINVAKGLFYYYFPKKESVLYEIANQFVENFRVKINLISNKKIHPTIKLNEIFSFCFSEIKENQQLLSILNTNRTIKNIEEDIEYKLRDIAFNSIISILKDSDIIKSNYLEYKVKVIISGFSDLYNSGVTDKNVYVSLAKEMLGLNLSV